MLGGYERVYTNEFVNHFFTVASLVTNSILLYFISKGKGKKIGNYRLLIICFSVNDLVYTFVHYFIYPVPETFTDSFLLRAHGMAKTRFAADLYIGNYGTSFPLLSAHFIYRSLILKWPQFPRHFYKFLAITIVVTVLMFGIWLFVGVVCFTSDEESKLITRRLMNGEEWSPIIHSKETEELYVVGTFWGKGTFNGPRWKSLVGAAIVITVLVIVYATITTCSIHIIHFLKTNSKSLCSLRLQKQLFKCLLYQTVLPLITAYFPAAYCMFAPILGLSWPLISIVMPNLCVMHSFIDGIAVLLTVSEYRKTILQLLCRRRRDKGKISAGSLISRITMNGGNGSV